MAKRNEDELREKNLSPNAKYLDILIRSRHPLIYVVTHEEERVLDDLRTIREISEKYIYRWDCVNGILKDDKPIPGTDTDHTDAFNVLDFIKKQIDDNESNTSSENKRIGSIFVLCDYFRYLMDPVDPKIERQLRVIADEIVRVYSTVVIISPVLHIPSSLEKRITIVDYALPDFKELGVHLDSLLDHIRKLKDFSNYELKPEPREAVLKAAQGLTLQEADNAFSKSIIETQEISDVKIIEEKRQIILKSGMLEFFESNETLDSIGGCEYLVEWLKRRKLGFTDKARAYGLSAPSGLLLVGIQGCGKSLAAKATAKEWGMPLLRLDVGRIFSSGVGDSERNVRDVIKIAESISPCILWIDEVDKGISGSKNSGERDGGTTARVYATLLTWLQEKKKPVFVIATANDVQRLDAAFLRRGRFDEIFFIDLPSEQEREEIAKIHIEKRGRKVKNFDLKKFTQATMNFSGAEIEACIKDALFEGFYDKEREIGTADLINAAENVHPLSEVMAEELQALKNWCKNRTKNASIRPVKNIEKGARGSTLELR